MHQRHRAKPPQPDLFGPVVPITIIPAAMEERLLPLISILLREAVGRVQEADHEDLA